MPKWFHLSCKTMGYILAAAGVAVILLMLLPVWAIIGIIGVVLILCGLSLIF